MSQLPDKVKEMSDALQRENVEHAQQTSMAAEEQQHC